MSGVADILEKGRESSDLDIDTADLSEMTALLDPVKQCKRMDELENSLRELKQLFLGQQEEHKSVKSKLENRICHLEACLETQQSSQVESKPVPPITISGSPSEAEFKDSTAGVELQIPADEGEGECEGEAHTKRTGASSIHMARMSTMGEIDYHRYQWAESVWDASLFIGVHEFDTLGSIFLALLLVANVFFQLFLCAIINDTFAIANIDGSTVSAMRDWRVYSGHSADFVDKYTFEPLARRVCNFDDSLMMSRGVSETLGQIAEYAPSFSDYDSRAPALGHWLPHMSNAGEILCLLAMMIWVMHLIKSVAQLARLSRAIISCPTGTTSAKQTTKIVRTDDDQGRQVLSISSQRKIYMGFILTIELAVLVLLALSGSVYMVFTLSLSDLLLNCSALTIVLELDELFYEALAPRKVRQVMALLEPLESKPSRAIRGLDVAPVIGTAALIIAAVASSVLLGNQMVDLQSTRDEICAGNLNFVATTDRAGVLTAGPWKRPVLDNQKSYYYSSMRQLITNDDGQYASMDFGDCLDSAEQCRAAGSKSATVSGMTDAKHSLVYTSLMNVKDIMTYWNAKCADMLPVQDKVYKNSYLFQQILRDVIDDPSIHFDDATGCSAFAKYCNHDNQVGVRLRQICPHTCGCDDPNHDPKLILGGVNGCPPSCTKEGNQVYSVAVSSRECTDKPLSHPYWSKFAKGLDGLRQSYPNSWTKDFGTTSAKIQEKGCNVVFEKGLSLAGLPWKDPCEKSTIYVIPLTYACPVSCKCAERSRYLCPATCRP